MTLTDECVVSTLGTVTQGTLDLRALGKVKAIGHELSAHLPSCLTAFCPWKVTEELFLLLCPHGLSSLEDPGQEGSGEVAGSRRGGSEGQKL